MLRSATFVLALVSGCAPGAGRQRGRPAQLHRRRGRRRQDRGLHARPRRPGAPASAARHGAPQPRHRLCAAERLLELAVLDFDEALKLSPQDAPGTRRPRPRVRSAGTIRPRHCRLHASCCASTRSDDRALNERGLIHLRKGDAAAAQADFEAALQINPQQRACAQQPRIDAGEAAQARRGHRQLRQRALRIDPDYLLAYANRARAYEAKGEIELALADFKQAAERKAARQARRERASANRSPSAAASTASPRRSPRQGRTEGSRAAASPSSSATAPTQRVPALRNPANDAKALAAALRGSALPRCASCSTPILAGSARRSRSSAIWRPAPTGR